jgi:serine/threonine-protein kinase
MIRADVDLLLGILALQNRFIDQAALIAGFHIWSQERTSPLAEILQRRGDLSPSRRVLLEALVEEHVRQSGGNPARSLAALKSDYGIGAALRSVDDKALHSSLSQIGPARRDYDDPLALPDSVQQGEQVTVTFGSARLQGRFRILRPYASGGLGTVAVALDAELNREVALKQIQAAYADNPESRARFVLEAEITGALEHPSIVPVYSLGHDPEGRPFYAMRFIQGDSLKQAIDRFHRANLSGRDPGERTLELQKLLRRFLDVCNAIAYAHSRGVLHRDIKPGNVMVGRFGETLLVDWGLAKVVGTRDEDGEPTLRPPSVSGTGETLPGSAFGTPQFMSPEQAAGRIEQLGPPTDVYSLGATLYCLLTGMSPCDGADVGEVLARVQRGDFPAPRRVISWTPAALEAVCLKAMALRPEDRYHSPRDLADDIELWLADEPVSAYPEPLALRARRWMKRHRTLVTSAAAALLVAVTGLSAGLLLLDQVRRREAGLNLDLKRSNDQLTAALVQVEQSNAMANRRLDETMRAIEEYYTGVSEELLLGQTEFQPLREKLLARPRAYYEALARELESSPREDEWSRFLLARGRLNLGKILKNLGRRDEALQQWHAAVSLFDSLVAVDPSNLAYQEEMAASHYNLGVTQAETGEHRVATEEFRKTITILESLPKTRPTDATYQLKVKAAAYRGLGIELHETGDIEGAIAAHRRSIELCDALVADHPDMTEFQDLLARAHGSYGMELAALGDQGGAITAVRRTVELYEDLLAAHPNDPKYLGLLSTSLSNLGHQLKTNGDGPGAVDVQRRAVELGKATLAAQPNVPEHLAYLAMSQRNLADALANVGDDRGATESCRQAIERLDSLVASYPNVPHHRFQLANCHGDLARILALGGDMATAIEQSRECIQLLEDLVSEQPELAEYRSGLATGHNHLGSYFARAGDLGGALREFRCSIELRQALVSAQPEVPAFQLGLAATYLNLGDLMSDTGDHRGAIAAGRRAIELTDSLAATNPKVIGYRATRAAALRSLGVALFRSSDAAGALNVLRQGVDLQAELVADEPEVPSHRYDLANVQVVYGTVLAATGEPRGAIESLTKAARQLDTLASADPGVGFYQNELAQCHNKLGILLFQTGNVPGAIEAYRNAIEIGKALVAKQPNIPEYQRVLASSLGSLGLTLHALGRVDEAVDCLRDAKRHGRIAFDAAPNVVVYRQVVVSAYQGLARSLRDLGRVAESAETTRERIELWPNQPVELYHASGELALCAARLGDPSLQDRARQAELEAEAIRVLRAAVAAGWTDAAYTATDPDLAYLHGRNQFQEVLDDLRDRLFPADPFAGRESGSPSNANDRGASAR